MVPRLCFAAELDDLSSVSLGGAAIGEGREFLHGFALGGKFEAGFTARVCFAIEGLCDCGGAAGFAEDEDFDLEEAALICDLQHVADADVTGGLGGDAVGEDAADIAGFGGEGAGLEEARGPEPFIDANGGHGRCGRHDSLSTMGKVIQKSTRTQFR